MKKLLSILLALCMLFSVCYTLVACDGGTGNNNTPTGSSKQGEKLNAPTLALAGNTAIWVADQRADKFEISLDGNLSYVENTITSKVLTNGQTMKIRAIGDGVNYLTSDWSNSVTYTSEDAPKEPTKLNTPIVSLSQSGMASWQMINNAVSYVYKIDGGNEVEISTASVQLINGQSISVKAIGDGENYTDSDWSTSVTYTEGIVPENPTKLNPPTVNISSSGLASWSAVDGAISYKYKIDGGNEESTTDLSVQLSEGQSISVKAVGDGVNYIDSDYSTSKRYSGTDTPAPTGEEPKYLGIIATNGAPSKGDGVPSVILPRIMARGNLSLDDLLNNHFTNEENHLGTQEPQESDYDVYSKAGETVYIQIWLNNPDQYTILSLMLNGTKYQVGDGFASFFIEDNGVHYNCVYVAVRIPNETYVEKNYTVTNIEYISDTFINADGTDEFMNENDTVTVGLPYGDTQVQVSTLEPTDLTTSEYKVSFDITDADGIIENSGSWLGMAVYDESTLVFNKGLTVGSNTVEVSGLAEETSYLVEVYIYGDLHDGEGVKLHTLSSRQITTQSAIDYFEVEAGYYSKWGFPEMGEEPDSGLSISVSLYLTSNTATYDRLELYKGSELVYTNEEFNYSEEIQDLLADTEYTVRVYYSDTDYSEHFIEKTVITGRMDKPEMNLQGKYSFLNSALFTFDLIENGYLRQAIAKNVRVDIYRGDIWQLEYKEFILKLCDDPELFDRTQAEFDEAIANGDWGLANKIDHESLTFLREAKNIINDGELGDFGTDRQAWEEYFDTVSHTFYLDTEDFFGSYGGAGLAHLIFRDYFSFFSEDTQYKVYADVDMKDGRGFVEIMLGDGSIRNVVPINSESNFIEFDYSIDGMNVKVNPYFKVNYEENNILVVSYEIGLYTTSGEFVDTLYTSKEVNWQGIDEDAWIDAYVCAMKGEAILPSEEEIIKEFGWSAIFEIINNLDYGFEEDFTGGSTGDVIVEGNGAVVQGVGRGEKNIANERERQILRELLAYDYPEDYEYDLKTTMLEAFMCDEFYYDLIDGVNGIDNQLEALISGALNSSIERVIGDCEGGIRHFLTWFGSEDDEIYIGFKQIIEDYMADTGKSPDVNWQESYRRIMMFKDFYEFYPFGYVEEFEIDIEDGKYPTGEYLIGIKYRYDSYEENRYETNYYYYQTLKITGKLPAPTVEIQNGGYIGEIRADVESFWDYHFEIEITNEQGIVVFTGRLEDWQGSGEMPAVSKDWSVRARTVFNDGATSDLYNGDSEWSVPEVYEGMRLEDINLEYRDDQGGVAWYYYDATSKFVYTINDGVIRDLPKKNENFIHLNYGDVLKIKAVPTDDAIANGYIESKWAEFTCEDERASLNTPINLVMREDSLRLEWDAVDGAEYYIVEISKGDECWTEQRWETYIDGLEIGRTYRVRAMVNSEELKSSDYSESVTYSVKLTNPEFYRATPTLIMWFGVPHAEGYNYKIGEDGEIDTIKTSRFEMARLAVGESLYVQAYAEGCESSDWVLIYTRTDDNTGKG